MSIHSLLCQSHKNIARSYDLIDPGNGFCSKSKGRHCLSSACLVHLCSTCQMGRNQCNRIDFSVFVRGSYHYNSRNPCNLSRDNIHQNGGGICCLASRNINAHTGKRRYLLSQKSSVWTGIKPAVLLLFFVIFPNIFHSPLHNCQQLRIYLGHSLLNLCFRNADIGAVQICSVKFLCIGKQSLISVFSYVLHNFLHCAFVGSIIIWISL